MPRIAKDHPSDLYRFIENRVRNRGFEKPGFRTLSFLGAVDREEGSHPPLSQFFGPLLHPERIQKSLIGAHNRPPFGGVVSGPPF